MRVPAMCSLISITDSTRQPANISSNWHAILRLTFDDVDPITFLGANPELSLFTKEQAEQIAEFVSCQVLQCKRMVIHCRHGVSRSAAVARAIATITGVSFNPEYLEYNRYVFQLTFEALKIAIPKGLCFSTR